MTEQKTRVTYSYCRKISDGNYGSHDFFCSISTDCEIGETPTQAIEKAAEIVHETLYEKVIAFKKKKKQLPED